MIIRRVFVSMLSVATGIAIFLNGCGSSGGNDGVVLPKSWHNPASLTDNISLDGQDALFPQVAMDNNGNIIIAWLQFDGANYQIYKSEHRNGVWSYPTSLSDSISPHGQDASVPRVAMDNNGNAIIVWTQSDGTNIQIFKSEYRNAVWIHPASISDNISPDGQDADSPQAAMDNSGNAIIVWHQYDGTDLKIFKSEYRGGIWTHPTGLTDSISPEGSADGNAAVYAQVAMDNNGNAIIVWQQAESGSPYKIFKSEYRGGVWTHPSSAADSIGPNPAGGGAGYPQVVMDKNGNAIIVWYQHDGTNMQIFKSEYRGAVWTHPINLADNISPDGSLAFDPQVAMDNNGNAIIVWVQSDGANYQIFKSEYHSNVWTQPINLADNISPDGQDAYSARVAMDNNGNVIIIWYQYDGVNYKNFKSEYRSGAWTHPANLSDSISFTGYNTSSSQIAINNQGNAIVVWSLHDGTSFKIFKSEYR